MNNVLKISINGKLLDLGEGKVSLNYSSGRLQEIETRTGFSSYEITVPATTLNKSILNQSQRNPASLLLDNNVVNTGFIQVVDSNKVNKTFKLIFFSGNNNWFEVVKEKQLTETNLDSDSFIYNGDNVVKPSKNIDFLLLNNGILTNARDADNKVYWQEFFPAISTKRVFEKIFNDAGYSVEGSLLSDGKFNNDFILLKDEGEGVNEELLNKATSTFFVGREVSGTNPTELFTAFNIDSKQVNSNGFGELFINDNNFSVFTLNSNIVYDCEITLNDSVLDNINNIFIRTNTVPKVGGDIGNENIQLIYSNENKRYTSLLIENIPVRENEFFIVGFRLTELDESEDFSVDLKATIKFIPKGGILKPNDLIFPQLLLPDMSQADFIREVAVDYSILFDLDESSKTIFIDSFDILNKNKRIAKSWDSKIINGDNETEDYIEITSSYGINNRLKRANSIGDGTFRLNNSFLNNNVDIFESDFDGLENTTILNQSFVTSFIDRFSFEPLQNVRTEQIGIITKTVADNDNLILEYAERVTDSSVELTMENKQPDFNVGDIVLIKGGIAEDVTDFYTYPAEIKDIIITKSGDDFTSVKIIVDYSYNSSLSYDSADPSTTVLLYLIKLEKKEIDNIRVLREQILGANIQTTDTVSVVQLGLVTSLQNIRLGYFNKGISGTIQDINTDTLDYNNIINNYYPTIINTLNNNTYLRTEALLSEVDIKNLKFSIPIKYKNDYYYLDSVEEYDGRRATVNLIKL